jgi:hypothetical protein
MLREGAMPILKVKDLALTDFIALIKQYHACAVEQFQTTPLMLAFSPAQALFITLDLDQLILESSEQGRIFSAEGELKWRRVDDRMRVVYLGDEPPPDGLEDRSSELADLEKHHSELILWGARTDTKNEWIEQQVPHRFNYPISTTRYSRGRAVVLIENWIDSFGFTRFSRYHSLKEIQGENHAEG